MIWQIYVISTEILRDQEIGCLDYGNINFKTARVWSRLNYVFNDQ